MVRRGSGVRVAASALPKDLQICNSAQRPAYAGNAEILAGSRRPTASARFADD
jgi:hypothetical protein